MRPVAVGRKNWIHIGSPQAGPKIAAILSVVESCRRLKLRVSDYLVSTLPAGANNSVPGQHRNWRDLVGQETVI
jgi:transposase